VLVPAVSQPRVATIEVAGQRLDVALKPVPRLTVYVVPHSHTDIGYRTFRPRSSGSRWRTWRKGWRWRAHRRLSRGRALRLERGGALGRGSVPAAQERAEIAAFESAVKAAGSR